MKRKAKRKQAATIVEYTHRDATGMLWRFEDSRPISFVADITMQPSNFTIQMNAWLALEVFSVLISRPRTLDPPPFERKPG